MGLGAELSENRCKSFCFAVTSDGRGHSVPSGSVFVGLITGQHEENLLGSERDLTGAGWERGRVAVNTSSNDLHNIQPYSSLTCPPTLRGEGKGGSVCVEWSGGGVTVPIKHYSENL